MQPAPWSLFQIHRQPSSRLWSCALLTLSLAVSAAGCGDDKGGGTTSTEDKANADDNTDETGDNVKLDAGGKKDAGKDAAVKKDTGTPINQQPPAEDDTPKLDPISIDECGDGNAAGISSGDIAALKKGGTSDGMRWLYPYDGTVFPRGLGSPLLMWDGAGTTAVYIHITAERYEYSGCVKPDAAGTLKLPQSAWDAAEIQTVGAKSPFVVELTVLDGKTVRGPISEKLVIAQATLKGSIYYNTYNSGVGGGSLTLGGTVERIKPGQPAEFFSRTGECTGCHSVSANGTRMVTKEVLGTRPGYVFAIDSDTQPNPNPLRQATNTSFVGIAPDGSVYLTTAYQGLIGPPTEGAITTPTPLDSILYETDSGNVIMNSGFPKSAMMPTFAADGTLAIFNDYTKDNGRTLALMDYDLKGRMASNQRNLYTTPAGYVGWPFLLPDNAGAIFTQGDSGAFSGGGSFITPGLTRGPKSDLAIVDVESGQASILARAMGYDTTDDVDSNNSYLPFPDEQHMAYYPTVSPVAAGGYFWVFFDSIRHYGNQGLRRQLWVTAVKVQRPSFQEGADNNVALYGSDLSNPAFYVPGQDFNTANHRAFTALDPCSADGQSCETGIDCCSGFCTDGICGPPKGCAKTNEKCVEDTDCCNNPKDLCVNGFCGQIIL